MVAIAWNNQDQFIKNSATFAVIGTSCTPTGAVSFCWPTDNDTVPTPITATAASSVPGLTLMRLYDNDQKIFETTNSGFTHQMAIGEGLHNLVVVAYDSSGNASTDQRSIRVTNIGTGSPCGIPDGVRDINICAPGEWESLLLASPVIVSARARWDGQVVSHIRLYIDHQVPYDADSQVSVYKQFSLPAGAHHLALTVWDNHGEHTTVARTFFVK